MPLNNNVVNYPGVVELPGLVISPAGGQTFFVGTSAILASLGQVGEAIAARAFTSVNLALAACVTGRGDKIYLLPGYTESIAAADAWSNLAAVDVSIIGLGQGNNRPTITWTIAGSTMLMDTAGFVLDNLVLGLEPTTGTVNVAAPITVSAAGCTIKNCKINTGTDANNKVTIGITTTAGAVDFRFEDNLVKGAALATMTTFLRLTGCDRPVIRRNRITCGTTAAAVGPIQVLTTAVADLLIDSNFVHNNAANSTGCIAVGVASTTGNVSNNFCRNMTDASNAQIVITGADVQLFQNFGVNNSNETGILLGTPSV